MNTIEQIMYNKGRNFSIKDVINVKGKIIEEEDKFVCYVDKFGIDRNLKDDIYNLELRGFKTLNEEFKKMFDYYDLDKSVYYIFENIDFNTSVEVSANLGTHVVFRNCSFKDNIGIHWADEITFENNKYYDRAPFYSYGNTFLCSGKAGIRNLRFVNDSFLNFDEGHHPTRFGMDIEVGELEIINTKIEVMNGTMFEGKEWCPNKGGLNIRADKIRIINSSIEVAELYLDSKSIKADSGSTIKASRGIIIENKENDLEIGNVLTPYLVYNGLELTETRGNNITINKENIELLKARTDLAKVFREVKDMGISTNEKVLDDIRRKLDVKPLRRVLKK